MKVLALNTGSSSVKFQLFESDGEALLARGLVEGIGEGKYATHEDAFDALPEMLRQSGQGFDDIEAAGHRIVHGGAYFRESVIVTPDVERKIAECGRLAPLHNPHQLEGIRAAQRLMPRAQHVAVFDTAFHQSLPDYAYTYALPYELCEKHALRRYGFHGISHRYVTQRAAELMGRPLEQLKLISMHLGNGCSACAVLHGQSVDTSMGLTPLEGLLMGTRTGDIDPAAVLYVMTADGIGAPEMDELLNQKSGLLGISGHSKDMRTLLALVDSGDERARLAVEVFCYRIRRLLGTYTAVMNGLDAVIFTGGIGENAATVRARAGAGLDVLGIRIDEAKNRSLPSATGDIAAADSRVRVWVIPANEEIMIARDTVTCLRGRTADRPAGTV